jgi:hypothetical protein
MARRRRHHGMKSPGTHHKVKAHIRHTKHGKVHVRAHHRRHPGKARRRHAMR